MKWTQGNLGIRTLLGLCLIIGGLSGCGETRSEPTKGYSDGVVDNNQSNGDQNGGDDGSEEFTGILVAIGERHTFDLESNPSTGYSWIVQDFDDTVLKLVSQIYLAPEETVAGASGNDRFTFEGLGVGQVTVSIEYKQPWDSETVPAETHEVEIKVTE